MALPFDDNERVTLTDYLGAAGSGALRLTLLFGSAAIALTIILTPMAEEQVARSTANKYALDQIATGSTKAASRDKSRMKNFTIRRSVLQNGKDDICIISAEGIRTGTC